MKIFELFENKTNNIPHLYLDMDGVQSDFFGEWARHHNVPDYKEIPNRENAIDLLAHSSPKQVYKFFRELPVLVDGMKIVKFLKRNKIPFTILSAPIIGPYSKYSIKGKKDWLDEHNPGTSSNAIFTIDKFLYATKNNTSNVLIDDYGKNINAWNNAGGIGIKHEDGNSDDTINKLKQIYSNYLNK